MDSWPLYVYVDSGGLEVAIFICDIGYRSQPQQFSNLKIATLIQIATKAPLPLIATNNDLREARLLKIAAELGQRNDRLGSERDVFEVRNGQKKRHGAQRELLRPYVEGTTGAKLPTSQSELVAPLEVHVAVICSASAGSCCSMTRKVPSLWFCSLPMRLSA